MESIFNQPPGKKGAVRGGPKGRKTDEISFAEELAEMGHDVQWTVHDNTAISAGFYINGVKNELIKNGPVTLKTRLEEKMRNFMSKTGLYERIYKSTSYQSGSHDYILLWKGYLTAGNYYALIEMDAWYNLIHPLTAIGHDEIERIYDGPMTPEEEEEQSRKEEEYLRNGIISIPGPTMEEDLRQRIKSHMVISNNGHTAICLWKGYLACLYESKKIDQSTLKELMDLLPAGPEDQIMKKIFYLD